MFNLKTPCKDCPFVKDSLTNETLHENRLKDIVHDLENNGHFFCHKTIDYTKGEHGEKFKPKQGNELCAGSLLYMKREGIDTQYLKVMRAMDQYDDSKLEGMEKIIPPVKK